MSRIVVLRGDAIWSLDDEVGGRDIVDQPFGPFFLKPPFAAQNESGCNARVSSTIHDATLRFSGRPGGHRYRKISVLLCATRCKVGGVGFGWEPARNRRLDPISDALAARCSI